FTDNQLALVETFADQAVIAIENTRLLNELRESLQQQTATADVLKVISRSTFDLQTVLSTLVKSAAQLCRADRAAIRLARDGLFHHVASYGFSPEYQERMRREPHGPTEGLVGHVLSAGKSVHVVDPQVDPDPRLAAIARRGNIRTVLGVPMLREGVPIGVLVLTRSESQPFTEKRIELVEIFADQAVIAIENVRLFDEVQARTQELTETLEYQTATGDVLNVISRSLTDIQPVFDMIAENVARLCEAQYCFAYGFDGQLLPFVAHHGLTADVLEMNRRAFPALPSRRSAAARAILERSVTQIPDVNADPDYALGTMAAVGDFRSAVGVPILREGRPIGSIAITRSQAGLLPHRQTELLQTFADQAALAIQIARLFDDVQARRRELRRSVAELQALGEVSRAVSSTLKLETVLETIVGCAVQLSGSDSGIVYEFDEIAQTFQARGSHRITAEHLAIVRAEPIRFGEGA